MTLVDYSNPVLTVTTSNQTVASGVSGLLIGCVGQYDTITVNSETVAKSWENSAIPLPPIPVSEGDVIKGSHGAGGNFNSVIKLYPFKA